MRASNEEKLASVREGGKKKRERDAAHTLEAYRRTERIREGRSRGCRWLPIESPFSVTEEILWWGGDRLEASRMRSE